MASLSLSFAQKGDWICCWIKNSMQISCNFRSIIRKWRQIRKIIFLCFIAVKLLLWSAKVNKWSQKCQKYAHTKVENRDISGVTTVHYAVWGRAMWRHKVQFCKQCSLTSFVLCHARQKQLFVYRLKLGPGWSYSPCSTRDVLTECPWLSWWELSCNSVLSYHLCSQHWSSLSLMQVSIFSLISIFCLYLKFQNHINIFAVGQKHLMRKLLGITNNTC